MRECVGRQFPYYIVRFKPGKKIIDIENIKKFPYYIVRFKLITINPSYITKNGFHTTKYDLNEGEEGEEGDEGEGFHTT